MPDKESATERLRYRAQIGAAILFGMTGYLIAPSSTLSMMTIAMGGLVAIRVLAHRNAVGESRDLVPCRVARDESV